MRKLLAVVAVILIATITVGCLDQARENPTVSAAATSTLKLTRSSRGKSQRVRDVYMPT